MSPYLAVLVLVLVAVCSADTAKKCCTEPQWEGTVSQLTGSHQIHGRRGGLVINNMKYAYDYKNRRIAVSATTRLGTRVFHSKVIVNYKLGRRYVIYGGKCKYFKHPGQFRKFCVPANATYVGRSYFGGGSHKFFFDTWGLRVAKVQTYMSFSTDGKCIPVGDTLFGQMRGSEFLSNVGFVAHTSGIKSVKVFTPPKGCRPGASHEDIKDESHMAAIFEKLL